LLLNHNNTWIYEKKMRYPNRYRITFNLF